jgi:hypothetical protein
MTGRLSRVVLALAMHSLGAQNRPWAQAMQGEFAVAEADGRALRFACGCLLGAWRMLPRHGEGRFTLTSYALSLGVLLPIGVLLAKAAMSGFPFVMASAGTAGFLWGQGTFRSLLDPGTQCLAPALIAPMLALAACHGLLAWWVLDRDWPRVVMASRLGAAAITALVIVMACAGLSLATLAPACLVLAAECAAVTALAAWQAKGLCEELI